MHLKNYLLPFFFLSIFIYSANAQNNMPKKYQSLLWEISGKGLKKPSFLYGTMHVSDKLVFNLPDSFFLALKSVNTVALELNMNTWIDDIMLMQEAEIKQNNTPYFNNNNSFYSAAFNIVAPEERDLISVLQFKPTISDRLMYRNSRQNSDYQEDTYLDAFIFQAGTKLNKRVIGLENYKQTEILSKKAELSERESNEENDEKKKEEKEQKQLWLKEIRGDKSYYDLMEDCYRKGDLDLLDSLNKLTDSDGFLRYMLYERNLIMANRMDSIMKTQSLFTGVGASHLPGDSGIIEFLRRMGYKVKPILSNKYDIKTKNQIDETRFPTQMKTQYAADSVFSVSVPGKLCDIPVYGSFKYYLFNDMGNGSYYCIQRMNHYGKLLDQNQDYILKRIDSLIFENIPGKLISKTESKTVLGYPKIEIVNKTAKGDIQKQQIIITPTEIYSFKMSGKQEYVSKGSEANDFFNSITFYESNKASINYQSKFGYTLNVPAQNIITPVPATGYNRYQNEIINGVGKNNTNYTLVIAASLYDFEYIEEDTFELNMLAERFCLQTNKKLLNAQFTSTKGAASIVFSMESKEKATQKAFGKIITTGADYFFLCSTADSVSSTIFFNSFNIYKKEVTSPFTIVTDTTLLFSAKAQEYKNLYSDLVNNGNDNYNRYNYDNKNESKEEKLYLPKRESKVYLSPDNREKVFVEFRKFSMFYHEKNMSEFWKLWVEGLSDNGKLRVSRENITKNGNYLIQNLLLTDTGSSKGIMVRSIHKCGVMHTLKTVIDTNQELSLFTKTFFDSFEPKDTCIGVDVVSDKLPAYFFEKLFSKDSIQAKMAKGAIEYVKANMVAEDVPYLIKTINHPDFKTMTSDNKNNLISSFEEVKSKETIPFLTNLYQQYADSVEVEIGILKTLGRLKTVDASKAFLKLLEYDVPITTNESALANMFSGFNDSLQMGQLLFPAIIKYTKYPEYKNLIYSLMSKINDAKVFKNNAYKNVLSDLLLDANYELKKFVSDEDRDKEPYRYSNQNNNTVTAFLNYRQLRMYNYTSILAPFYKDNNVKKFFNKLISSSSSDQFRAILYGQLLINNVKVNDTIIEKYSSSVAGRLPLFRVLKEYDKTSLFKPNYLNQKDLVISLLYGSKEAFSKDTLALLYVKTVFFENKIGNVYIFKSRPKDKKIWKLSYSAVHPEDLLTVNYKPNFSKTLYAFDSETQMQKEITLLMRKIRIANKERASVSDFEKEDSDDYDY